MKNIVSFLTGNHNGKHGDSQAHHDAKLAAMKFDSDEINVLKKTYKELADRTGGKGIDKDTFLQYFPLNGLLGERLFAQFDVRQSGLIDFDEFITGLAKVCRGTIDEKIHFLFNMYDVGHDNTVSKQELTTLLNHVPKEAFGPQDYPPSHVNLQRLQSSGSVTEESEKGSISGENNTQDTESVGGGSTSVREPNEFEDIDNYTNHDLVEKAFEECDLNHEGRLTYQEFKMWVQRTPALIDYIESILPYNGPKDINPHHHKREALPHMKRIQSRHSMHRTNSIHDVAGDVFHHGPSTSGKRNSLTINTNTRGRGLTNASLNSLNYANGENGNVAGTPMSMPSPMSPNPNLLTRGTSFNGSNHGPHHQRELSRHMTSPSIADSVTETEDAARAFIIQAIDVANSEHLKVALNDVLEMYCGGGGNIAAGRTESLDVYRAMVSVEGYLWKKGKSMFHAFAKRYFVLSGNCIYYYNHENDVRPKGVIFLTGSIIERLKEEDMELKGYYGFEITHQDMCTGEHHRHEKRVLYCKSQDDREKWVTTLQHAAHVVPIEDDYVIGKELGRGRFSVVCECVHKYTGVHCAVKIIDKGTIEPEEKGLLRTEIAVLKLVNHPNIIHMEGLYESKAHIYIVMEMLKGGELFERIVGRPRFTEQEAARLLKPLLESVAYLHDLGIVHRDLKPENILCGEELEDLKIADFGLSKMTLPKEKMDSACGTLSYVAPEVLTLQGYGKEADLWSVGVIMFLLLCGKLPFDGDDHNEIIRSTIQADLKVNPAVWGKLTEDAKSLITSLLNKNPKDRISAREALRHPFIASYAAHRRATIHSMDLSAQGLSSKPPVHPSDHPHIGIAESPDGYSTGWSTASNTPKPQPTPNGHPPSGHF